jgi:hypothetical protein
MPGLTERAAGAPAPRDVVDEAHQRWEASMLAELERLRQGLRRGLPDVIAGRVGGSWTGDWLRLDYWGRPVQIRWPDIAPTDSDGRPLSAFDQAMLLYYLRQSDGVDVAGHWISFRELPGGEFYHQAYQGYTGRRLAQAFGGDPARFDTAAAAAGERLDGPAPHAWGFRPLPRVPLAACLWPGDEEMAAQAAVLFDANAGHQLPVDGLALLGAGLTGRLLTGR